MVIKAFDPINSELMTGISLLEASAGTGKTYAIAMLVLRFIVEENITIKQLLVVTFTKAATEELRDRIRKRLVAAKNAVNHDDLVADADLQQWLSSLSIDRETIRQRLDLALLDIDQAAIFTIHGFCQRILTEHALESGQMFDCELTADLAKIKQNCVDDFWRKQLYLRPLWQVVLLTSQFATPEQLLASVNSIGLQQQVYPETIDLDEILLKINDLLLLARTRLPDISEKLKLAFSDGLFNGSYTQNFADKCTELSQWLSDVNADVVDFSWLTEAGLLAGLNGRKFMVSKAKPLSSQEQKQHYLATLNLGHAIFDQLSWALQQLQVAFRLALWQYLKVELEQALHQHNQLSFDSLIVRLAEALAIDGSELLINTLQQRFTVGLIDEFQDTDFQQWQIFSKIFADSKHSLYLIGDPKQAIYKFRGADIFSYFKAREQANYHYTLQQNWRSHPALVSAVNHLFSRNEPFLLKNLAFSPVIAACTHEQGNIANNAPMVLWQLDKNAGQQEHWTSGKASEVICRSVVQEILFLLNHESINSEVCSRRLQAKDIAILVRSNQQALDYQQALNAVAIPAIINSKQSVFASTQAGELFTVLQAVAYPSNIAYLKQALLVNWFNLDGQAYYRLTNDDNTLDAWINRWQNYHQLWQVHGLLTMMYALLATEQVEVYLSQQQHAERILANLHHLIERLQQICVEQQLTINKTLDCLRHAIHQAAIDSDEDQLLRLESDEDAVKIVTLHSAKGLEYSVVFCPMLWQRNEQLKKEKFLIQCQKNGQIIADLGSEDFNKHRELAVQEEMAEELRLCYVAVTRAKYRCYLCWANVRTKEKVNASAIAYLLDFAELEFLAQQQKLQLLAEQRPDVFAYRLVVDEFDAKEAYRMAETASIMTYRQRQRKLSCNWQMTSYTALSTLSIQDAPDLPEDKAVETN